MITSIKKNFSKLLGFLWSIFLNGLLTILPISITVALFHISINLIKGWLSPLYLLVKASALGYLPYTERIFYFFEKIPESEIIFVIIILFLVGTILKLFVLHTLIHRIESLLFKIPLVRPVYSGVKQLVHAFSLQDKITFKQVVIVEFPRKDIYSLGFLTSELPVELAPNQTEKFFNIFVPTTPNPTSGFFLIVPEREIAMTSLTRQEAMALIISGGIIQPDRFK